MAGLAGPSSLKGGLALAAGASEDEHSRNLPEASPTATPGRAFPAISSADSLALSLMLFQALTACAIAVTPVVANELTDKFQLSGSQIGLLSSLFLMMYCVGAIPMGMAAARWGGRVMAVGVILLTAGSIFFALSASYSWFLIARLVQGLGASAAVPVANALVCQTVPRERQGRALGIFGTGTGLGYLFALAVMPSLQNAGGYPTVFLVLAVLSVLVGLVAFSRREARALPRRAGEESSFRGVARALRQAAVNPRLWAVALINTGASATAVTILAWTPSFLEKQFGASLAVAAYLTAGVAAAQLVGNPLGALAMGRWGRVPVIVVSLVGMTILTALLPLSQILVLCFLIVVIAGFFTMAMFPAVIGIIPDVVDRPEQVGTATGFVFLFNLIGMMIPPWLFGKLLDVYGTTPGDNGFLRGYLMLAAFPFAGILATLAFRMMSRRAPTPLR
ncbi:MAG: MFS transporter [bacterium]